MIYWYVYYKIMVIQYKQFYMQIFISVILSSELKDVNMILAIQYITLFFSLL